MELLFDVPADVNGIALAADLAAAGHDVANVYITYPEGEPRLAVVGDNLDASAVGAVIAAFVPPAPEPSPDERRAAIIEAATDWKTAMTQLASEGLLA